MKVKLLKLLTIVAVGVLMGMAGLMSPVMAEEADASNPSMQVPTNNSQNDTTSVPNSNMPNSNTPSSNDSATTPSTEASPDTATGDDDY